MFEVGDIVYCKTFPKIVNGVHRDKDPNMTIGESYKIIQIDDRPSKNMGDLRMIQIMGEIGPCWYWSDYFYNTIELRILKLEKICSKLGI